VLQLNIIVNKAIQYINFVYLSHSFGNLVQYKTMTGNVSMKTS